MRVVTLGQLRGVNELPTAAKAALVVGGIAAISFGFVWAMQRSLV